MTKPRKNHGFTLVELIVVLVILAILAALAIPSLTGYIRTARERTCVVQRSSLIRYFKAAYAYEEELRSCTTQLGVEQLLPGKNNQAIGEYLAAKDYCDLKETICPVYHQPYGFTFWVKDGVIQVGFTCPCTAASVDTILKQSTDLYNSNKDSIKSREALIALLYQENKTLSAVDPIFTDGTPFAGSVLYWRPYYLNDGTIVLYASPANNSTHDAWKGSLVYAQGAVYYSTAIAGNKKPEGTSVASLYAQTPDSIADWAAKNKFTLRG